MIYVDMDGVLCDLVRQVEKYARVDKIYNESNYGEYHIQKASPVIEEEDLFNYFSNYGFWANMPIFEWSHYLIDTLEKIDKEIYIMSRPWLHDCEVSTEACMQGKIMWVSNHFPRYLGKLLFVDKKEDFAHPGAFLIDDNMENCKKFSDSGGKTIFIPTPWGDISYASRDKIGTDLVKEVLGCLNVVENM